MIQLLVAGLAEVLGRGGGTAEPRSVNPWHLEAIIGNKDHRVNLAAGARLSAQGSKGAQACKTLLSPPLHRCLPWQRHAQVPVGLAAGKRQCLAVDTGATG